MSTVDRKGVMLGNEGHLIQFAGNHGNDTAVELALASIDGMFNGLVRLQGAEETAKYAFAVADRVVGHVKTPTTWPPVSAAPLPQPAPAVVVPAPTRMQPRWNSGSAFLIGWACGLAAGVIAAAIGMAR